jgi:hypothetical protein
MIELVVRPLADAFMQVGVFMALLVGPFGYARYRWGHRLDTALVRHRGLGPVVAAALTIPPGCGGAIVVMALYARGAVSYGAAVAALVATMGDASWVLLAAEPVLTIQLKLLLFIVGAVTGHVVDALRIQPRRRGPDLLEDTSMKSGPTIASTPSGVTPAAVAVLERARHVELRAVGLVPALIWCAIGTGAFVSLPVTFQLMDPATVGQELLGGLDPYLTLGTLGTLVMFVAFAMGPARFADDTNDSAHPSSVAQVLRHGAHEVAFVTVWVAAAYLVWVWFSHFSGFDGSQLPLYGLIGILAGAAVGLIPGCGVQIVFTGIFLAGGMPLSTLVSNTISQDGDALIPLLALEQRSALLATVLTTIPAVLTGAAFVLLT